MEPFIDNSYHIIYLSSSFSFSTVVYKTSPQTRKLTTELPGSYLKEWGMIRNNKLASRNLPQRMRPSPKFEACKAVVLVIVTQVQPFLHGSNSTKMRIKESTIMIRSSLLLSQSDTLIRTWWISFLLYFILCYHVMFALKLEKFRLQNLRILTLLLLLRNSLSFFLFFLLFMCSNS